MDGEPFAARPQAFEWETPAFEEIPVGCEVTAYVAQWED
jgi:coenzyme PQQ precursor peptide PqqA